MAIKIATPEQVSLFKDVNGGVHETFQHAQVANAKHSLRELCGGDSTYPRDPEEIVDLILSNIDDFIEVLEAIRP